MYDHAIVESLQELIRREGLAMNLSGESKVTPTDGASVLGTGPIIEVARAQPLEREPGEAARSWVVTLSPLTIEGMNQPRANAVGFAPQLISDAFAVIEWGSLGSIQWAVVDWSAGQQFSVFGSYVRVWGGVRLFGTVGLNPTPVTRFSAHVVPGFSRHQPRRTIIYGDIPAADEVEFPVPAFASSVAAEFNKFITPVATRNASFLEGRMVAGAGPIWQDSIWNDILTVVVAFTLHGGARPSLLPIGSNFIAAVNPSVAALSSLRLIYTLAMS